MTVSVRAHILQRMESYIKINYKGDVSTNQDKANCLSTKSYQSDMDLICVAQRGRAYRGEPPKLEPAPEVGKTNRLPYPLMRGNKII